MCDSCNPWTRVIIDPKWLPSQVRHPPTWTTLSTPVFVTPLPPFDRPTKES